MSSDPLPYSMKDVHYDNAKFRQRSLFNAVTSKVKRDNLSCSTGKFLLLLTIFSIAYIVLTHTVTAHSTSDGVTNGTETNGCHNGDVEGANRLQKFWRRAPDEKASDTNSEAHSKWIARQQSVKEAFVHAWSGYKEYAMGYDELMPISKHGVDSLGGLGATVVDSLDTAMIIGLDDVVLEAGSWIESNLSDRISQKGQVNLFETTIRVLGGLLSAYHLSGGGQGSDSTHKGPKPVYLETAKNLADRLLSVFTSSPTAIPFSDVLHDSSAHQARDGLSSTSEVSTLQLEFNYLSLVSGDPKYSAEAMKVLEYMKSLLKTEGLVPIFISPQYGQFVGENIRLGSRGDSYYEYLIKVWIQQGGGHNSHLTYLREIYEDAMKGVKHLLVKKSIPNGLVFVGELPYGTNGDFSPKMDRLVCFFAWYSCTRCHQSDVAEAIEKNLRT